MGYKRLLVITDNTHLYTQFRRIVDRLGLSDVRVTYRFSSSNADFAQSIQSDDDIRPIDLKQEMDSVLHEYDLLISLHCKQIFPARLVNAVKCVNIHPGLNPYNRGWFPQVFSIINRLPLGATIHEMDELLDHGAIIAQRAVPLYCWDTSLTAYERVIQTELKLVESYLGAIVTGAYQATATLLEGNVNLKKDFEQLCKLNLSESGVLGDFLDRLRALSHGSQRNAYFIDPSTGRKVFVAVNLAVE